ncbi:hypothetical protein [Kitasatospora sp. NBC_01266]|uniref:hypothetical protein n=1 Tax=Kitasatospora sp. NBC_01266 TaxID=2903572 RepID=UPI002E37BE80|nr:hypothetical protein [Kitasatospora sp. NBC_01266]
MSRAIEQTASRRRTTCDTGCDTAPDAEQRLTVLARAHWPEHPADTVPPLPGFVQAGFNPLVAEVAARCLRDQQLSDPTRTGVLLASTRGDTLTPRLVAAALAEGRAVPPLLFYQSNPNAVAGQVAARWGLGGPVVCIAPPVGDPAATPTDLLLNTLADALSCAALLLADGEAEQLLVVAAEQRADTGEPERAVALLVTAEHPAPTDTTAPGARQHHPSTEEEKGSRA